MFEGFRFSFEDVGFCLIYVCIVGLFYIIDFYLIGLIGFGVFFCICEDMLKTAFLHFLKMSQKREQFSYEISVCDLFGFGGS